MTSFFAGQELVADDFDDLINTNVELDYAEILLPSSSFTAIADVSGLAVSFTLASTRTVRIDVFALVQSSIANDRIQITLADGSSTAVQVSGDLYIPANTVTVPVFISWRSSLAAATYTYKVRAARQTGTGTCLVNAGAARPCFVQALDVT